MDSSGNSPAAYLVGGFLFFGTGVLLLFHCSSMSHRKHRRKVDHSAGAGAENATGGAPPTKPGKRKSMLSSWRSSRKKHRMINIMEVSSVTIVITPPSPMMSPRSPRSPRSSEGDWDSIGSSSDLDNKHHNNSVTAAAEGSSTKPPQSDAQDNEVRPFKNDVRKAPSAASSRSVSMTSVGGIYDVRLIPEPGTSSDEEGEGEVILSARPRLHSMDRSVSEADFNIPVRNGER